MEIIVLIAVMFSRGNDEKRKAHKLKTINSDSHELKSFIARCTMENP